ncbi:hypothetical protein GBA63_21915 (plasmid) [Rubrobacter tropicus]|uniref:Uncharacterized protein n=1 Tax=Rubrobacter tropicus TaxID=2653851 RepID=A0A6G8QG41_9ACTN|nr:hypothetical protein [Rubrobacter tropicus]QIN85371.1 hypothetical protein GBA63_21915 [Rubrobacter tropicus]
MSETPERLLIPAAGPASGTLPVALPFASLAMVAFFGALVVLSLLVASGRIRLPKRLSGTLLFLAGLALASVAFAAPVFPLASLPPGPRWPLARDRHRIFTGGSRLLHNASLH